MKIISNNTFLHTSFVIVLCFVMIFFTSCNSCSEKKTSNVNEEPSQEELNSDSVRNVDSINPATIKPLKKGEKYVNINMHSRKGKKVTLARFCRGHQFTVVIFWTSWCDCVDEFHKMKDDYRLYKDRGVEFLGVSLDEKEDLWQNAVHLYGLPWKQFSDPEGLTGPVARLYDVHKVPYTIVLDEQGHIAAKGITAQTLDDEMNKLLPHESK
jgi:peroxiredoxin